MYMMLLVKVLERSQEVLELYQREKESSGVSPLQNVDSIIHSKDNMKASILNRQFVSVFTQEDTAYILDKGPSPYASMEGITVTPNCAEKLFPDKAKTRHGPGSAFKTVLVVR